MTSRAEGPTPVRDGEKAPSRRRTARRPSALVAALTVLVVLVVCGGCSGYASSRPATPTKLPPAAEPAAAGPQRAIPTGSVRPVGAGPEGLVVGRGGQVVVALRGRRLALVNPDPRVPVRTVAVLGTARHLQLATTSSGVLVPGEDTDTLAEIALPAGTVTRVTGVGRQPHDAAATGPGGPYIVSDELGSAVSFVAGGRETARLSGPVQPGGVASAGAGADGDGRAVVVGVRGNALFVYGTRPPRQIARLPAGAGPTHAVEV
ncbi:MAG: YncE family protein, partial [Frankia sp.]